jgi:hypothetical protein
METAVSVPPALRRLITLLTLIVFGVVAGFLLSAFLWP